MPALLALFALLAMASCSLSPSTGSGNAQKATAEHLLVIAHRGASGYRPEHTLAAYQLAIDQGADFIEPDLVPTKDGALIARHENALAVVALDSAGKIKRDAAGRYSLLSATTDVAERPEFDHLLDVRTIDGRVVGGWFSEDFTLAEIKTLYARERIPALRPKNSGFTRLRIPSLDEIINLLQRSANTDVGIYPELKHPTYFRYGTRSPGGEPIGIDTAQRLVLELKSRHFTDETRLYIQCFEVETLRRLKRSLLPRAGFSAPLVQLTGMLNWNLPDVVFHSQRSNTTANPEAYMQGIYGALAKPLAKDSSYNNLLQELELIASDYADGIGPRKSDARAIAKQVRSVGMQLHPYTIRAEAYFLEQKHGGLADSVEGELEQLRAMGATGVFIDQPDLAVGWQQRMTN